MARPIALAACAVSLAFSAFALPARAEPIRPVVPVPERTPGPDPLLLVTGGAMFALPYGGSVAAGAMSNLPADRWLYAPVIGPWASLIARGTCQESGCKGNLTQAALPLTMDGLVQAAGAYAIVWALTAPTREHAAAPPAAAQVHVVPTTYAGGAGLSAFGTF